MDEPIKINGIDAEGKGKDSCGSLFPLDVALNYGREAPWLGHMLYSKNCLQLKLIEEKVEEKRGQKRGKFGISDDIRNGRSCRRCRQVHTGQRNIENVQLKPFVKDSFTKEEIAYR